MSHTQRVEAGASITCSFHCASLFTAVMNLSDGDCGATGTSFLDIGAAAVQ